MRRLFGTALLLAFSPAVLAWSSLGHRMVGELAQRHLQPATTRAVQALLAGEAEPTLTGVADWADGLRNTDPQRFRETSRWHYVNFADASCHYEPARDCANGQCVVAAIQAQRAVLGDRHQPLARRRDALKFLVHLVGDVHQPMHAGHRGDRGGNQYQVSLRTALAPGAFGRDRYLDGVMGTNLHAVWDYYILATPGLDAHAYAARTSVSQWPPDVASHTGAAAWAEESCGLTDALYPNKHIMDRGYLDAQRPLAELRVRQAAFRLAQLLDGTLGSSGR